MLTARVEGVYRQREGVCGITSAKLTLNEPVSSRARIIPDRDCRGARAGNHGGAPQAAGPGDRRKRREEATRVIAAARELGQRDVQSLLFGGAAPGGSFMDAGAIDEDKMRGFVAQVVAGGRQARGPSEGQGRGA